MANTKDFIINEINNKKLLMTVTFDGFLIVQGQGCSIIKHIFPGFAYTNQQIILKKMEEIMHRLCG